MTLLVDPAFDAYVDSYFPATAKDHSHGRSREHNASLRVIAGVASNFLWREKVAYLGGWGEPDLLLSPPNALPWLIEYKSYRPSGSLLRQCVLQTFGYAAAIGLDKLERAYLVLGGEGEFRTIACPPPLDIVQIVTPQGLFEAMTSRFGEDLFSGVVTLDDLREPTKYDR